MHVEDVKDRKYLQCTQDLMLWLESSVSQLSKPFSRIENSLNIKEVMSKNMFVIF